MKFEAHSIRENINEYLAQEMHPTEAALYQSALEALPVDEADYGTERQTDAMNLFFEEIYNMISDEYIQYLEDNGLKATDEEQVAAALNLI